LHLCQAEQTDRQKQQAEDYKYFYSPVVHIRPFVLSRFLDGSLIPIVIKICAYVISTEGPQSGPKWRNLLKTDFSTPLRCARNDPNKLIYYVKRHNTICGTPLLASTESINFYSHPPGCGQE